MDERFLSFISEFWALLTGCPMAPFRTRGDLARRLKGGCPRLSKEFLEQVSGEYFAKSEPGSLCYIHLPEGMHLAVLCGGEGVYLAAGPFLTGAAQTRADCPEAYWEKRREGEELPVLPILTVHRACALLLQFLRDGGEYREPFALDYSGLSHTLGLQEREGGEQRREAAAEERFELEEALSQAVAQGKLSRAMELYDRLAPFLSDAFLESGRGLRSAQMRCGIANALFCRAALSGGAPASLAQGLSGRWAARIEGAKRAGELSNFPPRMIRSYIDLVQGETGKWLSPLVRRAIGLIHQSLEDRLTVAGLAAALAVSPDYLAKRFRAETGLTPSRYIMEARLKIAEGLLLSTRLPVQAVARKSGFSDLSYFGKCFKRRTGRSPLAYRSEPRLLKDGEKPAYP